MSKLTIRKNKLQGDLEYKYSPLNNLYDSNKELKDFETNNLPFDINHPVDIECQDSYDGSVNLIINDGNTPPRLINSAFTATEGGTFEKIIREQSTITNYYYDETVDSKTKLQRTVNIDNGFLIIDLDKVSNGGNLFGGNYVFMVKYCDEDNNETDVVAESGIISVFNSGMTIAEVQATLENEVARKQICLVFKNIDTSYSKLKLLYKRSYSDLTGVLK